MDIHAATLLDAVELETGANPTWSVVWLHGLGADGHDFVPLVPELADGNPWPSIRFVFPHAPVRAVTINNGARMRAWYDIRDFDLANRADRAGVDDSVRQVEALIAREVARGIPESQILLAGFSQGGAIALVAGLRRETPLAGIIALSTYLPLDRQALAELPGAVRPAALEQPVFMAHGQQDPVVPHAGGASSATMLGSLGLRVDWHAYPMAHQVCAEEIRDLARWMSARFSAA